MKVVFCLDDKPQYLMLLKGAVRSLRRLTVSIWTDCFLCIASNNLYKISLSSAPVI